MLYSPPTYPTHPTRQRHRHLCPDSASRSSMQGESDSEPEGFMQGLSNKLDSIFSSDSSDEESQEEDSAFDSPDKPVFLTSKGPVHIDAG